MTRIVSVGHLLPSQVVTSAELEQRLGLEPGWMVRRTGIRERRYAAPEEAVSDLAVGAAQEAIQRAGSLDVPIGLLLLATSTPDHLLPPTAPLVAHQLGLKSCGAIDLVNACSGFLSALALAHSYCQVQQCAVLIVAANVLSRRVNPADPATVALFGDGAGALILAPARDGTDAVVSLCLDSHGSRYQQVMIPAGGSRSPITVEAIAANEHRMRFAHGADLFRTAVLAMTRIGQETLHRAGLSVNEIDWWVPHQANARIIRDVGERLRVPAEKTISVVETTGNTSAASIPIALSLASQDGRLKFGQQLLLTAVGAGLTEAGAVIRWTA